MSRGQYIFLGDSLIRFVGAMLLLFLLLFSSWTSYKVDEKLGFQCFTEDSILVSVFKVYDSAGVPEMYKAKVSTPVCEDELCYNVELIFYWDLVGNFQKYELIPGMPLTKLKHKPFSEADYQKLSGILLSRHPAFVKLKKEQLITKVDKNQVDGISSATVDAVKKEVVSGAAYTCHTLWHIAHGVVVDKIREHTKNNLSSELLQKLVASNNIGNHYFLINSFDKEEFKTYLPEVLRLIRNNKGYFVWNAIDKFPETLFLDDDVQYFFSQNYERLDYDAQALLLRKLQNKKLSDNLAIALIKSMNSINYAQNELIVREIYFNINSLKPQTIQTLIDAVCKMNLIFSGKTYQMILSLKEKVRA